MYHMDVDTGGTMTDGLVSGNSRLFSLKIETTRQDMTGAFIDIVESARAALSFSDVRPLLAELDVIRWSSTITSNVLAHRTGPELQLLTSAGHEADLYNAGAAAAGV